MNFKKVFVIIVSIAIGLVLFQNCSQAKFTPVSSSTGNNGFDGLEEPIEISKDIFSHAISTFGSGLCIILMNESVQCWGGNEYGELGTTNPEFMEGSSKPIQVDGISENSGSSRITSGLFYSCALVQDQVKCWGYNQSGQLGDGTNINRRSPVTVPLTDVQDVVAGPAAAHTCALKKNGDVYCWGDNSYGQLGNGTLIASRSPSKVLDLAGIVQISSSQFSSCGVDQFSKVWCWGSNTFHILDSSSNAFLKPIKVNFSNDIKAVAVGASHACVLDQFSKVYCWGENELNHGVLGRNPSEVSNSFQPLLISSLPDVKYLGVGAVHNCALTFQGEVYCWGTNQDGQLGDGTFVDRFTPVKAKFPAGKKVVALAVGQIENCALIDDNSVWCWGSGYSETPKVNENLL